MQREWTPDAVAAHWTLLPSERDRVTATADHHRLGFALLRTFFQLDGRFPAFKHEVPPAAVLSVAQQVGAAPEVYRQYDWHGRTITTPRTQIRPLLAHRPESLNVPRSLPLAWASRVVSLPRGTISPHGVKATTAVQARKR